MAGKRLVGINNLDKNFHSSIGPKVKFRRCGRRWRIVEMRVPTLAFSKHLLSQHRVKVRTEAATSGLVDRSWYSFVACVINATSISLSVLIVQVNLSFNSMDENKRGVASEQRTWEASLQEASAALVPELFSVSDASSSTMTERSSLGSWARSWYDCAYTLNN